MVFFKKYWHILLFVLIYVFVFRNWFFPGLIAGGDFAFIYPSYLASPPMMPYSWNMFANFGLGGNYASLLWGNTPTIFMVSLLSHVSNNWQVIERVGLLYPYLILSLVFAYMGLSNFIRDKKLVLLSLIIFLLNSNVLMWVGGGLLVVALAYSLIPLVVSSFMKLVDSRQLEAKKIVMGGLLLGLQIFLDLRIAYMTLIMTVLFFLISGFSDKWLKGKEGVRRLIISFFWVGVISVSLNAFWVLPTLFIGQNPVHNLGQAYTSTGAANFLSFAKFEHSMSLLQPYWPQNIFGKVSFLDPAFLILPILAFSSLLFLKTYDKQKKLLIIFFSFTALLGIFLSKGTNLPFGNIYSFLFSHFPGFVMFREPMKWYALIAVSYSVMIPLCVGVIYDQLLSRKRLSYLFYVAVFCYLLFLLRPVISGTLTGLFQTTELSQDYEQFKTFVGPQRNFFRIGNFPGFQRYEFTSLMHPPVSLRDYFNNSDNTNLIGLINQDSSMKTLQQAGVKYIIIPNDTDAEFFSRDWRYDDKKYRDAILSLDKIKWLEPVKNFGKIKVYAIPEIKDHFWSDDSNLKISYQYQNPTKYLVSVRNAKKGERLIFSESYNPDWVIKSNSEETHSMPYRDKFNSFLLPMDGNYSFVVYFTAQKWVEVGLIISVVSLLSSIILIIRSRNEKL